MVEPGIEYLRIMVFMCLFSLMFVSQEGGGSWNLEQPMAILQISYSPYTGDDVESG